MRALPAFASSKSSLNTWIAALDRLEALRPGIIVPSYGPVGDAGYVTNYRIYLTRVRERVAALKREGKTVDKVIENVIAELKADYPDMSHAAGAIRAAYAETP